MHDPASDEGLIEMLVGELAAETGHMWRNSPSERLRDKVRHDRRMPDGECLTCQLLDLVAERLQPEPAERPVQEVPLPDDAPVVTVTEPTRIAAEARRVQDEVPKMSAPTTEVILQLLRVVAELVGDLAVDVDRGRAPTVSSMAEAERRLLAETDR